MRKHLFLLLGTACIGTSVLHAQNWVNGGNTLTANGTLGTNSSHALVFETANLPRGLLTNTGLWHLGASTTPAAKVQITHNSTPGTSPHLLLHEPANDYARMYFKNTNTTAYFGVAASPATTGAAARLNFLYSTVGDIMTIRGDKRVGIGTINPAATLHVVGNSSFSGSVGIGTTTPAYNLHVLGTIYGTSSTNAGVFGHSSYSGGEGVRGQGTNIGVYGYAGNYGVYGVAFNSTGWGVYGSGNRGVYGIGLNGVYGIANAGGGNAIYGTTSQPSSYGVFGASTQSIGVYGYTGNTSSYAGFFAGRVYHQGLVSGSDRKLKEDIVDVSNAMDMISKLQPKSYKFRHDGNLKLVNLPQGKHYGLIAQDVEQVLPELVTDVDLNTARLPREVKEGPAETPQQPSQEDKGEIINFKALNYTELIPIMVKAMQEQQQVINEQKELLQQQQQQINELKEWMYKLNGGQNLTTQLSSAKLGEVTPNPVKTTAQIPYAIPEGSNRAKLLITDALGRQLKVLQLSASGLINVDVSTLASGVYNYSLVVDNKTIATKRLTVER